MVPRPSPRLEVFGVPSGSAGGFHNWELREWGPPTGELLAAAFGKSRDHVPRQRPPPNPPASADAARPHPAQQSKMDSISENCIMLREQQIILKRKADDSLAHSLFLRRLLRVQTDPLDSCYDGPVALKFGELGASTRSFVEKKLNASNTAKLKSHEFVGRLKSGKEACVAGADSGPCKACVIFRGARSLKRQKSMGLEAAEYKQLEAEHDAACAAGAARAAEAGSTP